jgi:putative nucleotidyltransferase with HDIG domain
MVAQGETTNMVSTPRVVTVLSGNEEQDRITVAALGNIVAELVRATNPDVALDAIVGSEVGLVVMDADAPMSVPTFTAKLASLDAAPPVLLLLSETATPESLYGADVRVDHYLCRPFAETTLTALSRSVLETAAGGQAIQVRRPSFAAARTLYVDARRTVAEALANARENGGVDVEQARLLAEEIQSSLMQSNQLLLRALEPNTPYRLADHCVNVAIIAGKIADGMSVGMEDTLRVIQAGVLHDIGMARLPQDLLEKEGRLTEEEYEIIKRHPVYGAELIEPLGSDYEWLGRVVREEHERMRGQGYPRGLSGTEIDRMARIIAVADIFEAFSHPRTYRSTFTTYDALHKVIGMRNEFLDADVVDALVNEISLFPLDSFVLLNTGEIGRVVVTNPGNMMRPTVETLWDAHWSPIDEPRRIDLATESTLSIVRPLHETEVPIN